MAEEYDEIINRRYCRFDKIIAYFIQLNKYIKTSKPYHVWASRFFCAVGSGQKQVIGSWERLGGDGRRLVQETIKTVER